MIYHLLSRRIKFGWVKTTSLIGELILVYICITTV
jgi:hypothetical protein